MMKVPRFFRPRKLWAATARRSSAASAGMDFEEMPEPNMKLSRALLIVLLLHVVAVAGIIAFNAIKSRQGAMPLVNTPHIAKTSTNQAETKVLQPSPTKAGKKPKVAESIPDGAKVYVVAKGD